MMPKGVEPSVKPTISVEQLLTEMSNCLALKLLTGNSGLDRKITVCYAQRLGLALTGSSSYIDSGRIQILGQSENHYLSQLSPENRLNLIATLPLSEITAIIVTKGLDPPEELLKLAEIAKLPVLITSEISAIAIAKLTDFLSKKLAPLVILHGVMMEMFSLGILLQGESGVGKSECALDLITHGHRLISDDVVEIRRIGTNQLICTAPEMVRDHMEIRGLGILNIKDLFGFSSLALSSPLSLIIRLERWEQHKLYDRIGLDEEFNQILEVNVPLIRLPVTFGRNVSTLVEVAVRNHLLKLRGINAVREFTLRHSAALNLDPRSKENK